MWLALSLVASPAWSSWEEITSGLPYDDEITAVTYGASTQELWVGTLGGYLWHSKDGGETYQLAFVSRASEPLIASHVQSAVSRKSVRDFGRGLDAGDPKRERISRERKSDLAGVAKGRPREHGAQLVASVVSDTVRDSREVWQITECFGVMYLVSGEGLWRAVADDHFELLSLGIETNRGEVDWLSCDERRSGRLIVNTMAGVYESHDGGDTFLRWSDILGLRSMPESVGFDDQGRVLVTTSNVVLRERAQDGGFDVLCIFAADSMRAKVRWAWEIGSRVYGVTDDGLLVCDHGKSKRAAGLAGLRIAYVWVNENKPGHILVATQEDIFESFDGGETMLQRARVPTQRRITKLVADNAGGNLLLVTGGQIFRRVDQPRASESPGLPGPPLERVLGAAMEALQLGPDWLAIRRTDQRLRALLPRVVARARGLAPGAVFAHTSQVKPVAEVVGTRAESGLRFEVLFLWNLSDVVADRGQVDATWADLERLRARIAYRVQDAYALWQRETQALALAKSPSKAAYHELSVRQASAYLDALTAGRFQDLLEDS